MFFPETWATIQSAIDVCSVGDTILVAPGTYVENIQFNNKSPILLSESGPESTKIDGNQDNAIYVDGGGGVIDGFTINNSYRGILSFYDDENLLIQSCILFDNIVAIYLRNSYNTQVVKTLVYNNSYSGFFQEYYGGSSTIINCTFDNINDIRFYPYHTDPQSIDISNTVLMGHIWYYNLYSVNLSYCTYNPTNIDANVNLVVGNITDDPLFVDQANHDYHLQSNSPCIDTGAPSAFFNDEDGSRNDMGYTGGSRIFVDKGSIDFGYDILGSSSTQNLGISNYTNTNFTIDSFNSSNSQFIVNETFPINHFFR